MKSVGDETNDDPQKAFRQLIEPVQVVTRPKIPPATSWWWRFIIRDFLIRNKIEFPSFVAAVGIRNNSAYRPGES